MQSIRDLIPKDKFDINRAERLKGLSYEEVKPIIPELLEWVQDMNWPVAKPVSKYLESISESLTPHIITIFQGNDSTWKYWCLIIFGYNKNIDPVLLKEIRNLKGYATKMDIEEGVLEEVNKIIQTHGD